MAMTRGYPAAASLTLRRGLRQAFASTSRTTRLVEAELAVVHLKQQLLNELPISQEGQHYQMSAMTGLGPSFERERYDMMRSAWLKYGCV